MRLSQNFTLKEFTDSDTAKAKQINNTPGYTQVAALKALVDNVLQPLRDILQKPINIKSGYRSVELNKAIGGSQTSDHCAGRAADIKIDTLSSKELIQVIVKSDLEFDQAIWYCEARGGHVHISWRQTGNRNQVLHAPEKGGYVKDSIS